MSLSKRCTSILVQLASSSQPTSIAELRDTYKVSERTIRYDIKEIEYWLKQKDLGSIEVHYGKGFTISSSEEQRTLILKKLQGHTSEDHYYSSEERQKIIILELLNSEDPLKTAYLERKLKISRGTVIKELKKRGTMA